MVLLIPVGVLTNEAYLRNEGHMVSESFIPITHHHQQRNTSSTAGGACHEEIIFKGCAIVRFP
jgi:hypothetical protein